MSEAVEAVKVMRVSPKVAAQMLSTSYDTVLELVDTELFTIFAPKGRGRGRRVYLVRREVEVYGEHGEEGLRRFRETNALTPAGA